MLRHGSLFSGIGGFDLAAEWMGWENIFHCEWNKFGQRVLKYYWPKAKSYDDITKTDFSIHRGAIDILTGGFPCQPYSIAGEQKGTEDERHLWPEMLRAIREVQPTYVVGENVPGLINWSAGMVFEQVQFDLEVEGYEVTPFLLPASAVNAPHGRARIWFIAYSVSNRSNRRREIGNWQTENEQKRDCMELQASGFSQVGTFANASRQGLSSVKQNKFSRAYRIKKRRAAKQFYSSQIRNGRSFDNFPTQSPVCNEYDGISRELDGITFSKWRKESIKGGGNAIVPQVALQIFKAIEQFESLAL